MFFGIVNRMILAELVKVFLMSLIGLTGMFLLAGLIQEASQKGLSPAQIVMAIPLIIPNTLPFTIPATTLFATCVVYGRMSADNEVLVLKAAGVNIYRLLAPALVLGAATTAVTMALFYEPIPRSQQLLREQLLRDSENILYGMIKREGGMRQPGLEFVMFVRDVQGRDLIDVVVKKRSATDKTKYEFVARSQSARLRVREVPDDTSPVVPGIEPGMRKELVVVMDRCFVDSQKGDATGDFQQQEYAMALPASIFGKDPKDRPSSQTWEELRANRAVVKGELNALEEERDRLNARGKLVVAGKETDREAGARLDGPIKGKKRQLRQIETEMQARPALAVGCLCFVLIGCPVGIWASRADYLSVFMICFLPTVMAYYPISLAGTNMAKDEKTVVYSVWAADAVLFIAALFLIKRLMKR